MAAITCTLVIGAIALAPNDNLSMNLRGYAVDYWPPHASLVQPLYPVSMTPHFPVSTQPRALSTTQLRGHAEDIYDRIYMTPWRQLPLGNIAADQSRTIALWNAWRAAITLEDVTGLDGVDGVGLYGFDAPLVIRALRYIEGVLNVTQDGPGSINAATTWTFDHSAPLSLSITGSRVAVWLWSADWHAGVLERFEWKTHVVTSLTAREQRREMREQPRRYLSISLFAAHDQRRRVDLAVHSWGIRAWALPVWPDVQWVSNLMEGTTSIVCKPLLRDFVVDGLALLLGDDRNYEVLQISSISSTNIELHKPLVNTWTVARLYPVRVGRLVDQPVWERYTNELVSADIEFLLDDAPGTPIVDVALYRSWHVFDLRSDESQALTLGHRRALQSLDNGVGRPWQRDTAGQAMQVQRMAFALFGAEERQKFRDWIYRLAGRYAAVWVPSCMDDLTVTLVTFDAMDVRHVDYGPLLEGRRDIRITLNNGAVIYRRVVAAVEIDAQTQRLGLDAPLDDPSFTAADVANVAWMSLMRLSSDLVEIQHISDVDGAARAELLFEGVRDELS